MSDETIVSMISQCLRKKSFKTKGFADVVAEKRANEFNQKLRTYLCQHCDRWHITSKPKIGRVV